jgi:diguanylate cyclase (GGDEF)-like protein
MAVTVSIGLASRTGDDDVATLVQRADEAMYVAKQGGRNRVAVAGKSDE